MSGEKPIEGDETAHGTDEARRISNRLLGKGG